MIQPDPRCPEARQQAGNRRGRDGIETVEALLAYEDGIVSSYGTFDGVDDSGLFGWIAGFRCDKGRSREGAAVCPARRFVALVQPWRAVAAVEEFCRIFAAQRCG